MAYRRLKLFWGAVDATYADEAAYSPSQVKSGGTNAIEPGIGVRRAQIVFDRSYNSPSEDQITTSIDFLNITGGEPDDTWVAADFATIEARLSTFLTALRPYYSSDITADKIKWYRIGPAIVPPNPAVRILEINLPGTGTATFPHQVALTTTERTVPRRQWGRSYWPVNAGSLLQPCGRAGNTMLTAISNAADALYSGVDADDFPAVVYSPTRGKAYTVEHIAVDNVYDVIRSRRVDQATNKIVTSVP